MWRVIENTESFMIEDDAKRKMAFVYFSDDKSRGHTMGRPMRDEARQIAEEIARLPERLKRP